MQLQASITKKGSIVELNTFASRMKVKNVFFPLHFSIAFARVIIFPSQPKFTTLTNDERLPKLNSGFHKPNLF